MTTAAPAAPLLVRCKHCGRPFTDPVEAERHVVEEHLVAARPAAGPAR